MVAVSGSRPKEAVNHWSDVMRLENNGVSSDDHRPHVEARPIGMSPRSPHALGNIA